MKSSTHNVTAINNIYVGNSAGMYGGVGCALKVKLIYFEQNGDYAGISTYIIAA